MCVQIVQTVIRVMPMLVIFHSIQNYISGSANDFFVKGVQLNDYATEPHLYIVVSALS